MSAWGMTGGPPSGALDGTLVAVGSAANVGAAVAAASCCSAVAVGAGSGSAQAASATAAIQSGIQTRLMAFTIPGP